MIMRRKITVVMAAVPNSMFLIFVPTVCRDSEFGTSIGGKRNPTAMPTFVK